MRRSSCGATLFSAAALLLIVVGASACRIAWVHPEATREKYEREMYLCKFGTEPPTEEEFRRGDAARRPHEPSWNWRQCMEALGWTTDTKMRSSEPWDRG